MAGYTRQSTATIINGAGITAPPLNAEFNQIVSAFNSSSGHTHTGGTGDGPQIPLATSVTGYLPLANGGVGGKNNVTNAIPTANDDSGDGYAPGSLWENSSTGRIYVCVGNTSGAAVWRELVQQDLAGTMITDVDINGGDIDGTDIGVASVGTGAFSTISATGNITGNLVGNSTGLHTGAVTGDVTGNITSSGTSTFGAIDVNGGAIDGTVIGGNVLAAISGSTITGTSFVGPLTGTVAGNVTGNLAGNVTASSGTTVLNNLTVNGTIDVTSTTIENVSDPTSAQQAATKNYVDTQVSNLVSSAPAALDTLNELAAAIGDDANFSTTITTSIAAKLPLAGGTLTGNINAGGNTVTNLATPSANSDAATKAYVDTGVGSNAAAATSATNAANSATSAANSATAAASSLDTFQDTYLGAASSDPSTDLDGNALVTGALYFNSTSNVTKVYTGSEWQTASASIEGIKADFVYVATAGQTVFSGNDSSSNTMTIDTAGLVNVFLNGIRLITTTDYTVSAANNRVTLNSGATVGDLLEVEVFGNFAGQSGSSVAITGGTINNTTFNNVTYSGNISTTGTVDGRDVSVDGTKLDGIEAGATADQTAAEVRALVESASDSNVFTDADHTKLNAIEAGADVTDATNVTAAGAAMLTGGTFTGGVTVSSGNLLVGTTDTTLYNNTTGTGTKLGGDGRLDVARQADTVATFNRTGSSDGEIIRVISSGTTIGAIGSVSGDIALTSTTNPIRFSINNSEKVRFGSAGQLGIGGANYGTAGQILTSGGAGASPSWADLNAGFLTNVINVTTSGETVLTASQSGSLVNVTNSGAIIKLPTAAAGLYFGIINTTESDIVVRATGSGVFGNGVLMPVPLSKATGLGLYIGVDSTHWALNYDTSSANAVHRFNNPSTNSNVNNYSATFTTSAAATGLLLLLHSGKNYAGYGSGGAGYSNSPQGGIGYGEKLITSSLPSTLTIAGDYMPQNGTNNNPTAASRLTVAGTGVNIYTQRGTGGYYNTYSGAGDFTGGTVVGCDFAAAGGQGRSNSSTGHNNSSAINIGGAGAGSPAGTGGRPASSNGTTSTFKLDNGSQWAGNNGTPARHAGGSGGNDGTTTAGGASATRDSSSISMIPYVGKEFYCPAGGINTHPTAEGYDSGQLISGMGSQTGPIGSNFGNTPSDLIYLFGAGNWPLFTGLSTAAKGGGQWGNWTATAAQCVIIELKG